MPFCLAIACFLALYTLPGIRDATGPALAGYLDISRLPDTLVPLSGEWEIVRTSGGAVGSAPPAFAILPGLWENGQGLATYRLKLKGLDPAVEYGLRLPYMMTSYSLSVDGREIYANGEPGTDASTTVPAYRPGHARLPPRTSACELVLTVANFHHSKGGPAQAILFGRYADVAGFSFRSVVIDSVVMILFLLIGGMYLFMAIAHKNVPALSLGLLFICLGLQVFVWTPEFLVLRAFPALSWEAYCRLDYLSTYGMPVWALLATQSLFGLLPRRRWTLLLIPVAAIWLIVLLSPPIAFSRLNIAFEAYLLGMYALILCLGMEATHRKKPYAKAFSLGIAILMGSILSGFFAANDKIWEAHYLPLSFIYSLVNPRLGIRQAVNAISYVCVLALMELFCLVFISRLQLGEPRVGRTTDRKGAVIDETMIKERAEACGLSPREIEVSTLILRGRRNADIADSLNISLSTVKTHISRVFSKTGVSSRQSLFFFFQDKC